MGGAPATDWVVAVHSGPSSSENLLATLVAWARRHGFDPKSFNLWLEHNGRVLVLQGFTPQLLSDFLAYARAQSYPPLVSGPASQRFSSPSPVPAAPAAPPPLPPPPPPPADSSPLMQGVLQVLADRETSVRGVENWLMEVFGTLDIKESDVLWSLYLSSRREVSPALVALAATPSLRQEGSKMLGVTEEMLPKVLFGDKEDKSKTPDPAPAGDEEVRAHLDTYRRVLESNAHHWENVLSRMRNQAAKEGQMSAAVVVDELGGKVTWVFPRITSPVVRAVSASILHLFEGNPAKPETPRKAVSDTLSAASRLTKPLGLSLKWYVVFSGKGFDWVGAEGEVSAEDVLAIEGLLTRYGGTTSFFAVPKPKKPARSAGKRAKKTPSAPAA